MQISQYIHVTIYNLLTIPSIHSHTPRTQSRTSLNAYTHSHLYIFTSGCKMSDNKHWQLYSYT